MTWLGVPILDWVLLVFVLGLGVEAWLTTRSTGKSDETEPPPKQDLGGIPSSEIDRRN